MLSESLVIQEIKSRLYLIQLIGDSHTKEQDAKEVNRPLQFGEFAGEIFSTGEDFKLAEWRPTDEYLYRFE
jgi:hypothetical protein